MTIAQLRNEIKKFKDKNLNLAPISVGFSLSIGLIVIYYALLVSGKILAQKEILPPFLSMWMANIILGSIGLVSMIRVIRK